MHRCWSVLCLLLLAVACSARDRQQAEAPDANATCSVVDDPRCANPIDAVILPAMQRARIEPQVAGRHEFCRRLAIDLFGRAPTDAERDRCLHSSTEAIVDDWLHSRDYSLGERRYWATLIDYDSTYVWPKLVEDLDRLAGRLAREEVTYPEFTTQVLLHPAFHARHPDTDWFRAMFDIFLGRSGRPEEVAELMPLAAIWRTREFVEERKPQAFYLEYGFSGCACKRSGGCRSAALGRMVDFGSECRRDDSPTRMIGISAGQKGTGPTARLVDSTGNERVEPLPLATPEQTRRLRSLGGALAARLDFYEAAVDREMRRFLGWWQTSFNQPDTDLPRVRAALAKQLRETGSILELHRTILTSMLYTTSSMAGGEGPVWSSGPRKLMPVEAWIDTAAAAVGRKLPRCDHRFVASQQLDYYADFEGMEQSLALPKKREDLDYLEAARSMGGSCRITRVERPSIGTLEAQRALAVRLCAEGKSVLPPAFAGDRGFEAASGHLVERILGRPSTPEERDVLAGDMRACMARPDRGCAEPEQAVRWTCVRLLTSAEYATY